MKTLLGPLFCLCFLTAPGSAEITSDQFLHLTKLCSPAERPSGWLELDWEIDLKTLKIQELHDTQAEYKKWTAYIKENRNNMCSDVLKQYEARWQAYVDRLL